MSALCGWCHNTPFECNCTNESIEREMKKVRAENTELKKQLKAKEVVPMERLVINEDALTKGEK